MPKKAEIKKVKKKTAKPKARSKAEVELELATDKLASADARIAELEEGLDIADARIITLEHHAASLNEPGNDVVTIPTAMRMVLLGSVALVVLLAGIYGLSVWLQ